MSEKISIEAYIDQQFDESTLVTAIDMVNDLKKAYIEASIGKDGYSFYKLMEECNAEIPHRGDETVENLIYHSASDFIDTWVRATMKGYLPSQVNVCDIDDRSVLVSIEADHLPQYLNMYAHFMFDNDHTVETCVYFYNRSPNASSADQILDGLYEMDGRSVQGVDIRNIQVELASALISTYEAWYDDGNERKRL
jgi:hypothetical protein